jgi:cell shape-determining protein MreC
MAPIAWGGGAARHWLRPAAIEPAGEAAALRQERDLFRGLYHEERQRAEELQARLDAMDITARLDRAAGASVSYASARVTAVLPRGGLRLSVGAREGVRQGDCAVVNGDALVGLIAADVLARQSVLVPLTDRSLGRMDAVVVPAADDARGVVSGGTPVQLVARGTMLVGDIDLEAGVRPGDVVRLADAGWPRGARGMRLGSVVDVRRKDEQPLRGMVEVKPAVDPERVAEVVVKASGTPAP